MELEFVWPNQSKIALRPKGASSALRIDGTFDFGGMQIVGHAPTAWKGSERDMRLLEQHYFERSLTTRIRLDLPFLAETDRVEFSFRWDEPTGTLDRPTGSHFAGRVRLSTRDRGEARWSMNLDAVPRFTHLDIDIDYCVPPAEGDPSLFAWAVDYPLPFEPLFRFSLERIDAALKEKRVDISRVFNARNLGLDVDYYLPNGTPPWNPHRGAWMGGWSQPASGIITPPPASDRITMSESDERELSAFASRLESAAATIRSSPAIDSFEDRVVALLHDFAYYARQHAHTMAKLHEEQVRDFCVVPMKVLFAGRAEGECYHLRGKSDIKVSDPGDAKLFAVAEFKKWDGPKSLVELLGQLTGTHWTGQEALLAAVIISTNRDLVGLIDATRGVAEGYDGLELDFSRSLGKERFFDGVFHSRRGQQRIVLGIMDLDHPESV